MYWGEKKMNKCKHCCTKLDNISVKKTNMDILDNISLHLHCGELTAIIGKNGAGKSTLLKCLIGEAKYTGSISFSSSHKNSKKLTIGYVPQKLDIEQSPVSVYDLVCSFSSSVPAFLKKSKKVYTDIKAHLKEMEADELIDKRISTLSGGELQKVLIAIATLPYPELLILDEPVSGIDAKGKDVFYKLVDKIKNTHDISVIMVSHDFDKVKQYADKVVLINKKILKVGTANEVFSSKEFENEFGIGGN